MLHVTPSGRHRRPASHRAYKALVPNRIPYDKRQKIEEAIEAHLSQADSLIRTLDMFDKDADLEPSLGSRTDHQQWATSNRDDCEGDEHDGCEGTWPEWYGGGQRGGCYSDDDVEPSLAHTCDFDQSISVLVDDDTLWGVTDGEEECEDEGAQCDDEGVLDNEDISDEDRCPCTDNHFSM